MGSHCSLLGAGWRVGSSCRGGPSRRRSVYEWIPDSYNVAIMRAVKNYESLTPEVGRRRRALARSLARSIIIIIRRRIVVSIEPHTIDSAVRVAVTQCVRLARAPLVTRMTAMTRLARPPINPPPIRPVCVMQLHGATAIGRNRTTDATNSLHGWIDATGWPAGQLVHLRDHARGRARARVRRGVHGRDRTRRPASSPSARSLIDSYSQWLGTRRDRDETRS